jgi:aspartyl protease family protein
MWKHAVILTAAVISAVGAARGVVLLDARYGRHAPVAAAESSADLSLNTADAATTAPTDLDRHASSAEVAKAPDGHFWAEATVNGRNVRFLVDTGATAVALTGVDAQRLGLDPKTMKFDRSVATAAGMSRAALVNLDYVSVAGARVDHVPALVLESGLTTSLLGMTYLGRLSKFEATRTALILRP